MPASQLAAEFTKARGRKVSDLMSTDFISAGENTPVSEIAALLERHRIKRVPIVDNGKLVGVVSRSNLIQAMASSKSTPVESKRKSDRTIRLELPGRLGQQRWIDFGSRNIMFTMA